MRSRRPPLRCEANRQGVDRMMLPGSRHKRNVGLETGSGLRGLSTESRKAGVLNRFEPGDGGGSSRGSSILSLSAYKRWGRALQSTGRESEKGSPANGTVAKR